MSWVSNYSITEISIAITSTLGAIGAMIAFYRMYLKPKFVYCKKCVVSISSLPKKVDELKNSIDDIKESSKTQYNMMLLQNIMLDAKLSLHLSQAGSANFETDTEGNLVDATPDYLKLIEMTKEEAHGKGYILCMETDQRSKFMFEFGHAIKDKRRLDVKVTLKNGIKVNCKLEPIVFDKSLVGFVGYFSHKNTPCPAMRVHE